MRIPSTASVRLRPIWFIRNRCNAGDLHLSRRQLDEKRHESLESAPRPRFDGEEIGGNDQVPVLLQELFPGGFFLPAPAPAQFRNAREDLSDRATTDLVSQVGECALPIAPSTILIAMRTTSLSIPSGFRGRPGPRFLLLSYFCAIRRRCQASGVSGVTIVPSSSSAFRLALSP